MNGHYVYYILSVQLTNEPASPTRTPLLPIARPPPPLFREDYFYFYQNIDCEEFFILFVRLLSTECRLCDRDTGRQVLPSAPKPVHPPVDWVRWRPCIMIFLFNPHSFRDGEGSKEERADPSLPIDLL